MEVLRLCWTGERFSHHGARFHYHDLRIQPTPVKAHIDVWLGGIAPSELRRVGRLADGWLPSFVTPDDAARGREVIEKTLAEHGRTIDDDHYGALVPYAASSEEVPDVILAGLAKRRPDLADPSVLIPSGWDSLRDTLERFIAAGTTKFVVLPIVEPTSPDAWVSHLEFAAAELLPLQR
jgi:alkanesulfonate monooxygenase SsuD/methylene tetrahydromethanopterin reductase-like flavin-dependent oxidoreductase (luciferase family)